MSTQLAPTTLALVPTDNVPAPVSDVIADAVAACARARASGIALQRSAEQTLRAIREAGRRLSLVQRSDGGRPLTNSSRGLTSYQVALTQAGLSRQTANRWRRVAEIPEQDFERFFVEARRTGRDLTVAELLRACGPKSATARRGRTVTLILSEAAYRAFQQQVRVLGAVYCTDTATQTVMAVLGHAYRGWLAAQTPRSRETSEDLALLPRV